MDALEILIKHDIKPSVQRMAVMEYMLTHSTHPTVDEIYHSLSPAMPTLSKTTIYNTLTLFADQGVVLYLGIDKKNARFDGNTSQHGHFRCKKCGAIIDIFNQKPASMVLEGYPELLIDEIQIYYTGYCKSCNK
jgi:Fur family ferric uptake transcriptional regulator/Fur family peroxide stress response transcriptional regulator